MIDLREELAALAHAQWSGWMEYLFAKSITRGFNRDVIIPAEHADRWMRQMRTAYADLPENEKESDRKEADRVLEVLDKTMA